MIKKIFIIIAAILIAFFAVFISINVSNKKKIRNQLDEYCKEKEVLFLINNRSVKSDYGKISLDNDSSLTKWIIYCDEEGLYYYDSRKKSGNYEIYYVDYTGNNVRLVATTEYTCYGLYKDDYIYASDPNTLNYVVLDRKDYKKIDYILYEGEDYVVRKTPGSPCSVIYNNQEYVIDVNLFKKEPDIGHLFDSTKIRNIQIEELLDGKLYMGVTIKKPFTMGLYLAFEYNLNTDEMRFLDYCEYGMDGYEFFYIGMYKDTK